MEKYRLVGEKNCDESSLGEGARFFAELNTSIAGDNLDSTSQTEVKITQQGKPRNYISYAINLFVSEYFLQSNP